ncbi:hypothetical protein NFI96_022472 [Prochilodus magdalenae]|nr:hypothetical protein NFI96_022472 [Prochilodus magdalenae]
MVENDSCHRRLTVEPGGGSPELSALMFATGVLGNLLALAVLEFRRQRRCTLFRVLVTALVVTDLAGTCLISPVVQVAHALNTSLVGMGGTGDTDGPVCEYFGFTMTLFSLSTLALLLAMALERCIAIAWPYEYVSRASARYGLAAVPTVYALSIAFCALPFAGVGNYVQYCPGTWCFIDMNPQDIKDKVFANVYATLMLVMVLLVVGCNCFEVYHLVLMYRRRVGKWDCATVRGKKDRRHFSLAEEVEHLIVLVIMTVIFVICSLPLMIRVYINATQKNEESHKTDLVALRFISVNSIIDPWVFIILSPSVLRFFWGAICKASKKGTSYRTSLAKSPGRPLELCQNSTIQTEITHLNKSAEMI